MAEKWPGWISSIFGGSSSPCDKAKASVKAANATVTEVYDMLTSLNETLLSDVLDSVMSSVADALAKANSTAVSALADVDSEVPPAISNSVRQAVGILMSTSVHLQTVVNERNATVMDMVSAAQGELSVLYSGVQGLSDLEDSYCNPADEQPTTTISR